VTPEQLRLAACALLIELAYSDEEFSDAEKRHLEELIRRRFDLDPSDAERLLQLAEAEWDRGGGIHEFATLIAERFTEAEKHSLLDAMWGLVLSDGELAEHERRLMAEITDLLELESSWRSQATSGPVRRWMKMFFGAMRRRWAGEGDGFEDLHLAAAALLVELVYADEDFSDVERHHVEGVLQREFGMTASQARQLVELTEAQRDVGFDVRELTSVISSHYGTDQKAALVDAMWGLVLADGELARKERYFMGEVMELMGLEPEWLETRRPPARADTDDGEVNR
jgi:uncharacterized tellurite resistance protein B-like protein